SPKTICDVRVTLPFSFSLCCTRSERRMFLAPLAPNVEFVRGHLLHFVQRGLRNLARACEYIGDYVLAHGCGKVACRCVVPDVQHLKSCRCLPTHRKEWPACPHLKSTRKNWSGMNRCSDGTAGGWPFRSTG